MNCEHVSLLDCTLRDGAYLVNKEFGDSTIRGIIDGLLLTNLEFIEIGFLQNEGFGEGKTVYLNSNEAKKYIPKDKKNSRFTVLADCSRYSTINLERCTYDSIDAVRQCFFKHEQATAISECINIKEKDYLLFVQPVDILGYTDKELIELIEEINKIEPYCFSIVDTFGSMYQEDLHRIFELVNHNLVHSCKIGFHSHNNLQLSSALSQDFIRMSVGKREIVIDGTINGMGRGAGNTPTELVAHYITACSQKKYNIDALLDLIDVHMENIHAKCKWGYNTPYFMAGCYGAHVNNVSYLTKKNSIRSRDIRFILNQIGLQKRKSYDYDNLERIYYEYVNADIDDSDSINYLNKHLGNKAVLLIAPGASISKEEDKILNYIYKEKPIVVSINFIHKIIPVDFLYLSNIKRYQLWSQDDKFDEIKKIVTSNINNSNVIKNAAVVSFIKLIKCGWNYLDNSMLMMLRLLDRIGVNKIIIAGFDGFDYSIGNQDNYYIKDLDISSLSDSYNQLNQEIQSMYFDYCNSRINQNVPIEFLTESRFKLNEKNV